MVVSFSHYELLGLDRNATDDEIRNAYKLMSKSLHPDKNGYGNVLMQQINNAKEVLLDRSKRNEYGLEKLTVIHPITVQN
jgi:DnaJ-class molecular chaperone